MGRQRQRWGASAGKNGYLVGEKTSTLKKWITIWHNQVDAQNKQVLQIPLTNLGEPEEKKAISFVTDLGKTFAKTLMKKDSMEQKKADFMKEIKPVALKRPAASDKLGGQTKFRRPESNVLHVQDSENEMEGEEEANEEGEEDEPAERDAIVEVAANVTVVAPVAAQLKSYMPPAKRMFA